MKLSVRHLSFAYKNHPVLEDIDFAMEDHGLLCVLGPNGVGKTTLFKCMLGLYRNFSGEIVINDRSVSAYSTKELAQVIAYIPQAHAPSFNFTVSDIVLMGTTSHFSTIGTPGKRQFALAQAAMERVNIAHLRDRSYLRISGGERQLVLIARALAQQAKILVMDEPTSNLDYGNQVRMLQTVKELADQDYIVIQSTHNPDQAFIYADQVISLWDHRVLGQGRPQEMINAGLIKQLYNIDVVMESLCEDKVRVCLPKSILN